VIDYSGDSVLAFAPIGPGPTAFTIDEIASSGYTINSDGTLTNFPISSQLQEKQILYTTLPPKAKPVNLFSPSSGLWAADLEGNDADVFNGSPQAFKLAIPVAETPVFIAGPGAGGQRDYAVSQQVPSPTGVECNLTPSAEPAGMADGIEVASNTVSSNIPLGKCPVYAVQSPDSRRFFVLNRGDDTITVINSQNNTLDDQCPPPTGCVNQAGATYYTHPTLPLSTTAVTATGITPPNGTTGMPAIAAPVYAEYNSATTQLVVADYLGGTISVIDVSLDEYGNDSATFGTTYTIQVGQTATPYPASVTVLADGTRAYTANQGDCTPDCTSSPNGTVSVVELGSHTLEKTLPVTGLPRTVVSTQNSQYGKVYVASPNSPFLTIIQTGGTSPDTVDTTILVEGNIVDARVSTQTGSSGNTNNLSRVPGYGQPCNLPPNAATPATLAACQRLP
jgi:DNA-binding beta-propeller fold protein YncE